MPHGVKLVLSLSWLLFIGERPGDDERRPFGATKTTTTDVCGGTITAALRSEIRDYEAFAHRVMHLILDGRYRHATYNHLRTFIGKFGGRYVGTDSLRRSIAYLARKSRSYGLENVRTERFAVDVWHRYGNWARHGRVHPKVAHFQGAKRGPRSSLRS